MLRIVESGGLTAADREVLFQRDASLTAIMPAVEAIMVAVRAEGDAALLRFTREFDGAELTTPVVTSAEFSTARATVGEELRAALEMEVAAVRAFHTPQLPSSTAVETAPGVRTWREWRPIERVGFYVPGGRGPYPSSVIMLGVPAAIAGCPRVVLCTPPATDGTVPAATLVAAEMVGIRQVFKAGGAQAIAAMAYGTESVPAIDKLFGAGNAYVTAAKLLAFPACALDAPAGPSELLVLADDSADPRWIAADLLSDAEHGPDSPAVLITTSRSLAERVAAEIARQMATLPRRALAEQALAARGLAVVVPDLDTAIDLANTYAAEHLEIITRDPHAVLPRITQAGSIFLGPYAPNAAGDYATGTNHVLPTARYARTFAPVSVESFGRLVQCQELTAEGLQGLTPTVARLARAEGLEGHARAVEIRVETRSC